MLGSAVVIVAGCGSREAVRDAPVGTSLTANDTSPREPLDARDVIVSSGPWSFRGVDGIAVRTPSYEVFTTERTALLRDRLPLFMELALAEYRTALAPLPPPQQRMRTFLMDTRPQWAQLTRTLTGDRAEIFLRIQRGGFAYEANGVFFDIGLRDTLNIAAHEGWHQYTQTAFTTPLPVYLEEGIAAYMEGFRWDASSPERPTFRPWSNPERFDQLREAARRDRLLPLDELLVARPQDLLESRGPQTLDYYAQVWALVHFLREGDDDRHVNNLSQVLEDAASGRLARRMVDRYGTRGAAASISSRRGPGVFALYFGDDLDRIDAAYRAFIDRLVRPGSRDAIIQGRSPLR